MEPNALKEDSPSKIADFENFYLDCLKNGSYVQTQEE